MTAPDISLFELGPTRSARVRWALLEAGLDFESIGNEVGVFNNEALHAVHPLGKLPAILIDGRPLFESAAILTAIADLVPEKKLIAPPGSWSRNLHYQWLSFTLSEMEAFLQSTEVNSIDFIIPENEHVSEIIPQNGRFYKRAAAVLDDVLQRTDYLIENRFSVTDIFVGYTIYWGDEQGLNDEFPGLQAYRQRLCQRPHCTLPHD